MKSELTRCTHAVGRPDTVIILGGKGGLEARYREAVAAFGYELKHYERRVPPKERSTSGKVAMVIVMVTMVSHPLMQCARSMASGGTAIVYLKSPSISALRDTVSRARGREPAATHHYA